jgi:hypothetical protein
MSVQSVACDIADVARDISDDPLRSDPRFQKLCEEKQP